MAPISHTAPLLALTALLASCAPWPEDDRAVHDEELGFDRADFRKALAGPKPPRRADRAPEPIASARTRSTPLPLERWGPLVSIAVNESAPIKDVLLGLARQAGQDIEIDPRIEGGLIFSAQNRPFFKVIERIADMAGLRYRVIDDILRVELDEPYHQSYPLNLLSLTRSTATSIATSVDVFSGEGGGGNGSSSAIETSSKNDLWADLETALTQILASSAPSRLVVAPGPGPSFASASASESGAIVASSASAAPSPSEANSSEPNSSVETPRLAGAEPVSSNDEDSGVATALASNPDAEGPGEIREEGQETPSSALRAAAERQLGEQAGAALEELRSASTGASAVASSASASANASGGGPSAGSGSDAYEFSINRAAGLVSVYGASAQHRAVAEYIDRLNRTLGAQVLIEAKVLEVGLDERFSSGVNWRAVLGDLSVGSPFVGSAAVNTGPFETLNQATQNVVSIAVEGTDFDAVASLVEEFGTVRTLSSPRVTVLHNHAAVLKVAENRVFFELDFETETDSDANTTTTTVSSEINTVPVGVVITVQPSINTEEDSISMTLRPTVTRVTEVVADPATAIASGNTVESQIPVVAVQEIDSVVKMSSGDAIVMGGLMQDDVRRNDVGVPLLGELPFLGALFKTQEDVTSQTELVIFLRATILDPIGPQIGPEDARVYRTFARDRRPLFAPAPASGGAWPIDDGPRPAARRPDGRGEAP